MELVTVRELFKNREQYLDKKVTVGGWIRSIRDSKTQSVNMCTLTTLNVVILHSIIKHRHPAIIRFCYWMIMQPKGGFSPLPSYIYQFIIKSLDFCLDN